MVIAAVLSYRRTFFPVIRVALRERCESLSGIYTWALFGFLRPTILSLELRKTIRVLAYSYSDSFIFGVKLNASVTHA